MPLLGVGLIKKEPKEYLECSDFHFYKEMERIENIFINNKYVRSHPFGERVGNYEVIEYVKIDDGVLLRRIAMSIEYIDEPSSIIPYKVKIEPLCGHDLVRWREEGMELVESVVNIFLNTGLLKCIYYCSYEAQYDKRFFNKAEREDNERLSMAMLDAITYNALK